MRAWLKGGIFGAIIGLIFWMISSFATTGANLRFFRFFVPLCSSSIDPSDIGFCNIIIGHISNIVLFGIIGIIIGLIIAKIRK